MRKAAMFLACGGLWAFACDPGPTEPDVVDGRVEIPPAPDHGVQFVSPDITIPAGEERMVCWVPDATFDETVFVRQFVGAQNGMGHHLLAFVSQVPRQPGESFDCTESSSMTTIKPFLVQANEPGELEPTDELSLFPAGYAVRVEPGTRLVFQSHYINVGERDMVIADVANLHFVPEDELEQFTEVGFWTLNHGAIDIAPSAEDSFTASCDITREFQMLSLLGHMHEWGTSILVERERDGARETVYEIADWEADMRDLPPIERFDPVEPLRFLPGDRVHVTCSYQNDTDEPLRFPSEMCTAFGAYYGDVEDGFFLCD